MTLSTTPVLNADLHCHSTVSDGLLAPADVVRRAHANGVDLLALTDHDELGGLPRRGQRPMNWACALSTALKCRFHGATIRQCTSLPWVSILAMKHLCRDCIVYAADATLARAGCRRSWTGRAFTAPMRVP